MREIRHQQKSTDLLIPKAVFVRLVHEIFHNNQEGKHSTDKVKRIQASALKVLQEVTEAFLVGKFESEFPDQLAIATLTFYRYPAMRNSCQTCHDHAERLGIVA